MNNQTVKPELKSPEMKAAYFAQYWGQKVGKINERQIHPVNGDTIRVISYLLLTQLDQITDEQMIEIAMYLTAYQHPKEALSVSRSGEHHNPPYIAVHLRVEGASMRSIIQLDLKNHQIHSSYSTSKAWIFIIDFIRSLGFAIGWNSHSVQELIEAGYMKLREGGEKK